MPLTFVLPLVLFGIQAVLGMGGSKFCYNDAKCGPQSASWGGICVTGKSQSPINVPKDVGEGPFTVSIPLKKYKLNSFNMLNNGKTVGLSFTFKTEKSRPSFKIIRKAKKGIKKEDREYVLENIHYHGVGSEHCIGGNCFASEIHLVHYRKDFNAIEDAIKSGEADALAVIGVLMSYDKKLKPKNSPISSITKHLTSVLEPGEDKVVVNNVLDVGKFFTGTSAFAYEGSLTTPPCNEQVQWILLKDAMPISFQELKSLQKLQSTDGLPMLPNFRKVQPLNGREVGLIQVKDAVDEE